MFAVGNSKIDDVTSATMLLEEKRAIAPTASRYRHRHTASECSQSFLRIRGSHAHLYSIGLRHGISHA